MIQADDQEAIERRRLRNREAQRRFRQKKRTQSTPAHDEAPSQPDAAMYPQPPSQELTTGNRGSVNLLRDCLTEYDPLWLDDLDSLCNDGPSLDHFLDPNSASSSGPVFLIPESSPASSKLPESPTIFKSVPVTHSPTSPIISCRSPNALTYKTAGESSGLDKETSCWLSPMHIAAQKGNDKIVRILIQYETDMNEQDGQGLTPLMHAVIGGHENVVQSLLSRGAHIGNDNGPRRPSALHLAVSHRRENLVRLLLRHCSGRVDLIDYYDHEWRTPLHVAIDIDFDAGVLALLEHGADPQRRTLG